jgi:hypothetical protein
MEVYRPDKLTDETVKSLEEAFLMDCSVEEACFMAKISKQTYYNWVSSFPDFKERFDGCRQNPFLIARKTIFDNLNKEDTAKWYLERRSKDFKPKSDITSDDKPIPLAYGLLNNEQHEENSEVKEEN